jgi:predicted RNA binding protein YcfA (HicA-like mRNA interferase family)
MYILKRHLKVSSKKVVKFLIGKGYRVWKMSGSHFVLIKANTEEQLQVPTRKELGQKTLNNTLTRAGFTLDQFIEEMR